MLEVRSHQRSDAVYLALTGRLDGSPRCESVGAAVKAALADGHRRFVFDLSQLVSISSCGIGCLIRNHVRLQRTGACMALLAPNRRVLQVLQTTRLVPQVFEVVDSVSTGKQD